MILRSWKVGVCVSVWFEAPLGLAQVPTEFRGHRFFSTKNGPGRKIRVPAPAPQRQSTSSRAHTGACTSASVEHRGQSLQDSPAHTLVSPPPVCGSSPREQGASLVVVRSPSSPPLAPHSLAAPKMSAPAAAKAAKKWTALFRGAGMNYLDALTVQTTALRKVCVRVSARGRAGVGGGGAQGACGAARERPSVPHMEAAWWLHGGTCMGAGTSLAAGEAQRKMKDGSCGRGGLTCSWGRGGWRGFARRRWWALLGWRSHPILLPYRTASSPSTHPPPPPPPPHTR